MKHLSNNLITKAQYNVAFTVYFILFPKKPKCPILEIYCYESGDIFLRRQESNAAKLNCSIRYSDILFSLINNDYT